jgi:ubiquinone/menaquinone biosynthesis C-methylase UbiE
MPGIVVKPGNYEALAKTVLYLKGNPSVASKLGKSERRDVENNLSIEKIARFVRRARLGRRFGKVVELRKGSMGLCDEIDVYGKAKVSVSTGEIEDYDAAVFTHVIRKREIGLIKSELQAVKPKRILDLGCGGGWLSKILGCYNYEVIGIDVSCSLVNSAKRVAPTVAFVVGDGMNLPFREGVCDAVVCIATLHHLDAQKGLKEVRRILKNRGMLMLMEPNKLNPLSTIGRKLFPMETHTMMEEPFIPAQLRSHLALQGFKVKLVRYLFFFSFPLARMLKLLNSPSVPRFLIYIVNAVERVFEHLPLLNSLNSTIVVLAE